MTFEVIVIFLIRQFFSDFCCRMSSPVLLFHPICHHQRVSIPFPADLKQVWLVVSQSLSSMLSLRVLQLHLLLHLLVSHSSSCRFPLTLLFLPLPQPLLLLSLLESAVCFFFFACYCLVLRITFLFQLLIAPNAISS